MFDLEEERSAIQPFFEYQGRMMREDYVGYAKAHDLAHNISARPWSMPLLGTMFLAGGLLGFFNGAGAPMFPMIAVGVLNITWPFWRPATLRLYYQWVKAEIEEASASFSDEVVAVSYSLSRHLMRWQVVKSVVDSPDGILLTGSYRQPLVWIPRRALGDEDARERIVDAAQRHGVKIMRFGRR